MIVQPLLDAIAERRKKIPRERALLVAISGIDASGKGFVASQVANSLGGSAAGVADPGCNVAVVAADGWLNLPAVRFRPESEANHFYEYGFVSRKCSSSSSCR